jgi:hypothetical protein
VEAPHGYPLDAPDPLGSPSSFKVDVSAPSGFSLIGLSIHGINLMSVFTMEATFGDAPTLGIAFSFGAETPQA